MSLYIIDFLKNTKFQLIILFLAACYTTFILGWKYKGFNTSESLPPIKNVTREMVRYANVVEVGLQINSFLQFSFNKNEFGIDGTAWFKFPIGTESLDIISQFTIKHALLQENGHLIYRSKPIIRLSEHNVFVAFHIQTLFKMDLNYRLFPIGDHKLSFILQNRNVTPYEIVFVSKKENFDIAPNILVENWNPFEKYVQSGFLTSVIDKEDESLNVSYPCVAFSIDFENVGLRDIISLYFPMFVLFIIGLFSFSIKITDLNRLLIIASSLPILALFRMVIDSLSPVVGYTTHIDFVYYLLVFLSLLILFFQAYVVLALQRIEESDGAERQRMKVRLERLNAIMYTLVLIIFIVMITYNHFQI